MKYEEYEKPSMKFVELRNREAVANPCWNKGDTSTVYYYDSPGTGFISFTVTSSNCSLNDLNINYHDVPVENQAASRNALIDVIRTKVPGNFGQSWQQPDDIKDEPDPTWS